MSYSTLELLKKIEHKKVLFLNIKTSGHLKEKSKLAKPEEKYEVFTNNTYYNDSRLVELEYYYTKSFSGTDKIKTTDIVTILRKPTDFEISKEATKLHKILQKDALTNGIKIKEIFDGEFCKQLKKCEYIIGYNIFLHMSVLLNELHRKGMVKIISSLQTLFETNKILCLGIIAANSFKPKGWSKVSQYQIPNIEDTYFTMFDEKIKSNITACVHITNHMIETKEIKQEKTIKKMYGKEIESSIEIDNFGKKWKDEEITILEEELLSGIKMSEIAKNHGRTFGSVRAKMMSLAIDEMIQEKDKAYIQKKYGYSDTVYDMCVVKMDGVQAKRQDKIKNNKVQKIQNMATQAITTMTNATPTMSSPIIIQILANLSKIDKKLDILLEKTKCKNMDATIDDNEYNYGSNYLKSDTESESESELELDSDVE